MPLLSILFFIFSISPFIYGDAIVVNKAMQSPSIAQYYVKNDGVSLELELSEDNLLKFADLYPNSTRKIMDLDETPAEERIKNFLETKLSIVADGIILPASISSMRSGKKIIRDPISGDPLPLQPEDAPSILYLTIEYPFIALRPKNLDLIADVDASIGFVLYHDDQAVNDFRYLSKSSSLTLDWDDPWYSKFENKNLSRHYKYPLMVYLYVEPRLVRLESLVRIDDMVKITSFGQKDKLISSFKENVKSYFKHDEKLHIESRAVTPDQVDVSFFRVGLSGLELLESIDEKDISSLLIGVSQQYYVDKLPESIESSWHYFNDKMEDIPFVATDPKGPYPGFIYKDSPAFEWINYIKDTSEPQITSVKVKTGKRIHVPLLGDIKIWSELPNEQQTKSIIEKTFTNLQTAFIEKEDERLEKELKKIIHSDDNLLKKELSKLFSPSIIRGGTGSIKAFSEIKIDNIRALKEANAFSASLSGSALVVAYHWGHNDNVVLKFKVLIDFIEENGKWFIRNFSLLDLKDA